MNTNTESRPVLIVDDDPMTVHLLDDLLQSWGYETVQATSGGEALQWLDCHPPPKMVLLDLNMPMPDGWVVLDQLRQRGKLADVPVAVCSGMTECARPETLDGTRAQFMKPINPTDLRDWQSRVG